MTQKVTKKRIFIALIATLLLVGGVVFFNRSSTLPQSLTVSKPSEEDFQAPGREWPSEKKVEGYFIEHLNMTPQEAQEVRSRPGTDGKVMLRLRENTTLEALLSNLEYYGFVRDKGALHYALLHTPDTRTYRGKTEPLKIGENTIDTWAYYRISENMTAWEIADELLNNPTVFSFDEYNYMFMP
jgi:hypothetical protein